MTKTGMIKMQKMLVLRSSRCISSIPTPTTKKPTLEEFDPLNPGEWVEKFFLVYRKELVLANWLWASMDSIIPKQRRLAQEYSDGLDAGRKSEAATPVHARWTFIAKILAHVCFLIGCWNITVLTIGRPLWPYANAKPPGSA
ncbi:hypothetical protein M3Y97_00051300 [Aphelenchoides bicaudatus]|nr:hypothetical protein M3Y97_00051300 [Aphelenchoides bicaudatus]